MPSRLLKKIWNEHWLGEHGVKTILILAYPIILSNGADSLQMFFTRLFLGTLDKELPAASMNGGMTAYFFVMLFSGVIGYTTALVAQYFGAKQAKECTKVLSQSFIISLLAYPVVVFLGLSLGRAFFVWSGHSPHLVDMEYEYFKVFIYISFVPLICTALSGFFTGIGETRIVMISNAASLMMFLPLGYFFIKQEALGLMAAAYINAFGGIIRLSILLHALLKKKTRKRFNITLSNFLVVDFSLMKKFFIFGGPSGIESILNFMAFIIFVSLFDSYGSNEAAAVTITFSWDVLIFLPILGLNMAVTSLSGRFMGAGRPDLAEKTTYSALKIALLIMGFFSIIFTTWTPHLVALFAPDTDYMSVMDLGVKMLKWVGVYCLADASSLIFSATLRAAGDTRWCMINSVFLHWTMLVISYICIRHLNVAPIHVWYVFVMLVVMLGLTYMARFLQGKWKHMKVI